MELINFEKQKFNKLMGEIHSFSYLLSVKDVYYKAAFNRYIFEYNILMSDFYLIRNYIYDNYKNNTGWYVFINISGKIDLFANTANVKLKKKFRTDDVFLIVE